MKFMHSEGIDFEIGVASATNLESGTSAIASAHLALFRLFYADRSGTQSRKFRLKNGLDG
jgi:hypothetical protein